MNGNALHKPLIVLLHTYHSCLFPEGDTEASQIFLRDVQVLPK
jgi:hypothetical protein